jgi:hypothetical protein
LMYVWYGVAAGTGSCQLTVGSSSSTNVGITGFELSGQMASPIDTTGTNTATATTMTVTATSATTQANDFGVIFWFGDNTTVAASGWTAHIQNTFDGNLGTPIPTSGTTASAAMTGLNGSAATAAYLVVVK